MMLIGDEILIGENAVLVKRVIPRPSAGNLLNDAVAIAGAERLLDGKIWPAGTAQIALRLAAIPAARLAP